jgi:iron complex outermembrane receptor protein
MMATRFALSNRTPSALAALALCGLCSFNTAAQSTLPSVVVSGRMAESPVDLSGFGDVPLHKLPMQANVLGQERQKDAGVQRLADLSSFDASVSDAYNAAGYIDYLTVRGFVLDNRFNYQRDGLPISAETALPLANKASMELLKGISGMQLGTSAPGGAVNLIVKRPTLNLSSATLSWRSDNSVEAAVDLSRRFGSGEVFGLRINAAAAHLDPSLRDAKGQSQSLAIAADWRISPDTLLEVEFEDSRQSQPSQPGFSLLGNTLPDAKSIAPRINLNNQPWSLPVVFDNSNASLRLQQRLNQDWRAQLHLGVQHLKTDDRAAFPFGCYDAGTDVYYADRYCPNGNFDLYDYRSDNERRNTSAFDLQLNGKFATGPVRHELSTGILSTKYQSRYQQLAFNYAGTGNVNGQLFTSAAPDLYDGNTDRDQRSTELYLRDTLALTAEARLWAGARHTRISRDSVVTDGSSATSYTQSFTTPWLAMSYQLGPQYMLYASWGEGVESAVAPRLPRYVNAGQGLTPLKSRQSEFGLKSGTTALDWSVNWFDIERPQWSDIGACDVDGSCERKSDGIAHHRGIEAMSDFKWRDGGIVASAMWLKAAREGSATASVNGLRPANVPNSNFKLQARQRIAAVPGLTLMAGLVHEASRMVLEDNSVSIPAWTRIDLGARLEQNTRYAQLTWRAGIDNVADTRAWKESPFQFGHAYLYPLAPRTLRLSVEMRLP